MCAILRCSEFRVPYGLLAPCPLVSARYPDFRKFPCSLASAAGYNISPYRIPYLSKIFRMISSSGVLYSEHVPEKLRSTSKSSSAPLMFETADR